MENSFIALMGRSLFLVALIGYGLCVLAYLAYILFPKRVPKALPTIILAVVSIVNLAMVFLRSAETHRSPFSSRYEAVSFFGMTIGIIYLLTELKLKIRVGGLFASLIAFLLFLFTMWWIIDSHGVPFTFANIMYLAKTGGVQTASKPLAPALQSPWFFWHVSLAFFGYAFFTSGFVLELTSSCISAGSKPGFFRTMSYVAIAFGVGVLGLIIGSIIHCGLTKFISYIVMSVSLLIVIGMLLGKRHVEQHPYDERDLERISRFTYNQVLFAFPLLTWCVVSGGAWADKAWGTYWGWDPKEIWSLITWLIYASYFHFKGFPEWRGRPASVVHVIGFTAVLTTFLMVDYLVKWFDISSIHAYS